MTDNVRRLTTIEGGGGGGGGGSSDNEDPRAGSVSCGHCGSHAMRLTIDSDHEPVSIDCFNCGDTFADLVWASVEDEG